MDLRVFNEANSAVRKIIKDYQPIERLVASLVEIQKILAEVGSLDEAQARAKTDLAKAVAEKVVAEGELANVKAEVKQAQATLEAIKSALSGIKL